MKAPSSVSLRPSGLPPSPTERRGSNERRREGPFASIRFRLEAVGFGLGGERPPVEEEVPALAQLRESNTRRMRSKTETMKVNPVVRRPSIDTKAAPRPAVGPQVDIEVASVWRRRCFSDPGFLARFDGSLTWAVENETDTAFLRDLRPAPVAPTEPAHGDATKELLWTEDGSVAYVLVTGKDGSTSFSIRKGVLRAIVEQIVLWLVRPPGSSKASRESVEKQLLYFICAHERVITTNAMLSMLHEIAVGNNVRNPKLQNDELLRSDGVFKFISFWIQSCYYPDFISFNGDINTETMPSLHQFILSTFSLSSEAAREHRTHLLGMIKDTGPWLQKSSSQLTQSFDEKLTRGSRSKTLGHTKQHRSTMIDFSVLDAEDAEIAEALTCVDARLLRSTRRAEVLSPHFENLKSTDPSAGYNIYAERLKKFGLWIATQLVSTPKLKARVRIFRKWVLIAKRCVLLNNFSSTCAILAGLSHPCVQRLSLLLREIPADVAKLKLELEDNFMGFSDNYVRSLIQDCISKGAPCIPTIDVLRKDVLRIDEGSKGDVDDGLLKFFKLVSFGKAIHFIEQAHSNPFPFENAPPSDRRQTLLHWVTQMPNVVKSAPLLMKMSFELEKPSAREARTSLYRSLLADAAANPARAVPAPGSGRLGRKSAKTSADPSSLQ